MTEIPGLGGMALTLFSELGRDMSRWGSADEFVSWLALCPDNDKTGGKVVWRGVRGVKNRAGQMFRMAANALHHSATPLGQFLRRMKARLGAPAGITAAAHDCLTATGGLAGFFFRTCPALTILNKIIHRLCFRFCNIEPFFDCGRFPNEILPPIAFRVADSVTAFVRR